MDPLGSLVKNSFLGPCSWKCWLDGPKVEPKNLYIFFITVSRWIPRSDEFWRHSNLTYLELQVSCRLYSWFSSNRNWLRLTKANGIYWKDVREFRELSGRMESLAGKEQEPHNSRSGWQQLEWMETGCVPFFLMFCLQSNLNFGEQVTNWPRKSSKSIVPSACVW